MLQAHWPWRCSPDTSLGGWGTSAVPCASTQWFFALISPSPAPFASDLTQITTLRPPRLPLRTPFLLSFSPRVPGDVLSLSLHTLIRPFTQAPPPPHQTPGIYDMPGRQPLRNTLPKTSAGEGSSTTNQGPGEGERKTCTWRRWTAGRSASVQAGRRVRGTGEGAVSRGPSPGSFSQSPFPLRPNF